MMAVETRKDIRLPGFDYSQAGVYFVTVCSKDHRSMFGEIVGGDVLIAPHVELSPIGRAVEQTVRSIPAIRKYVIMPDHIHFIAHMEDGSMSTSTPTKGLPSLVRLLKRQVSVACGESVWQRNYYEHIIRNQTDYLEIWHYIDTNPARRWEREERE